MYHKSLFPDLPEVVESNVHNLILNRPDQREWPDYTLFVNVATGQRRSFKQFVERVRDGATALGADVAQGGLGLRPENGELVGILSDNCPDYIALMHSLLVITVPFALFSSYSTPHEFERANSLARVTRIFVSPSLLPLALSAGLPADRIYLLEGEDVCYTNYDQLVSSARESGLPRLPAHQANKDTLAYLVFSSGTSGPPKAVMISHGNIAHTIVGLMVYGLETAKILEPPVWDTPDGIQVHLNVLPVYHSFSLFTTSFFNFIRPSTIVMLPKWNVDLFFDSVPKYRITTMSLVPSLVHQLVHHPRFKTTDMSSVRSIGSGAAHLPPQLADELYTRFPDMGSITEGYGLSEFTVIVSLKPIPGMLNGRAKNKPGSVGILLPGVEARIIRPDGSLANPNEAGELLVRGGAAALGYRENDKATRETFVDGWVRTGDRIRIDDDGVLFFEDRAKDTLKISGMQVSPVEIENTILAQPDKLITDVSVAGVSGGRTSDERVPRAWIVLSPTGAALGEEAVVARLHSWVQERLSRYKWLRGGIGRVEMIPKSLTGKVLRRILVEEYESDMKAKAKL
jgi:acyl-CoA synthetase (AMP-forming)/AMP-acid ligase II